MCPREKNVLRFLRQFLNFSGFHKLIENDIPMKGKEMEDQSEKQ
jgi:hypothetical protein